MSPKILAVDATEKACSVALLQYTVESIIERFEVAPQKHAELILPLVEDVLNAAAMELSEVTHFALNQGPGAFTGLRIAAGTIQGLAYGTGKPVVNISSLASLALGAFRQLGHRKLCVIQDARIKEVYWGLYQVTEDNEVTTIFGEGIARPEHLVSAWIAAGVDLTQDWYGVGSGWVYANTIEKNLGNSIQYKQNVHCRAKDVAILAALEIERNRCVQAAAALPKYIRQKVV